MAEPLSIAASAAGLIGLGIQVVEQYMKWYESFRNMSRDVSRTLTRLESLHQMLQSLDEILDRRTFLVDEADLLKKIEGAILNCYEAINALMSDLKKSVKYADTGKRSKFSTLGNRVLYPLRTSTLQTLEEEISDIRHNISLALDLLQLKDLRSMEDDHDVQKALLERIRGDQLSADIRGWLNAPIASENHNIACSNKHPGTGSWFVKGDVFKSWLRAECSFVWLRGFAGCGKSVLCSTAIQHSLRYAASNNGVGVSFFYFSFNDEDKQDASGLLRSLLLQLSDQTSDGPDILNQLYVKHKIGMPSDNILLEYLKTLIERFETVFILIDALDESPEGTSRNGVLQTINEIYSWPNARINILVTSRHTTDIQEYLRPNQTQEIEMDNDEIDADIENFIVGQLQENPLLQKFYANHEMIAQTLSSRANGVFRWAECQLKRLERCPSSVAHLERCLNTLPRTLDETYERTLGSIDEDFVEDARRILALLCFSSRPLTIHELIEGIAMDLPNGRLDRRRRYTNYDDIQDLCPGLITTFSAHPPWDIRRFGREGFYQFVRIAHFSVQEYLESDRIKTSKAACFHLESEQAHFELALVCLFYLSEPELSEPEIEPDIVQSFPLAPFAAKYWPGHYFMVKERERCGYLDSLIVKLFERPQRSFMNWPKLYDVSNPRDTDIRSKTSSSAEYGTPLYYACFLGLNWLVQRLCIQEQERGYDVARMVNSKGGYCGSALGAASNTGNLFLVNRLLEYGATVSPEAKDIREYTNPFQEACKNGHVGVAQRLLDAGADANELGLFGTALRYAARNGHEDMVRFLITVGAEVNPKGDFDTPLMEAAESGNFQVVEALVDAGANIYCCRSADLYGSLRSAISLARGGEIQRLFQEKTRSLGANERNDALVCFAMLGDRQWVEQLIQKGADVNHCAEDSSTAIQQASAHGHEDIVALLIANGADVNKCGIWDTALSGAAGEGHQDIVQLLIQAGADVNQRWKLDGRTALQQAVASEHEAIVQILLEHGADVKIAGGCCTALTKAALIGSGNIGQMLIEAGGRTIGPSQAIDGGHLEKYCGHQHLAHLLLKNGIYELNADCEHLPKCKTKLPPDHMEVLEKTRRSLLDNGVVDETVPCPPCCNYHYKIDRCSFDEFPSLRGRSVYAATATILEL